MRPHHRQCSQRPMFLSLLNPVLRLAAILIRRNDLAGTYSPATQGPSVRREPQEQPVSRRPHEDLPLGHADVSVPHTVVYTASLSRQPARLTLVTTPPSTR